MIIYPNAKINLGLNIVEKRSDGYHNIETIFYPVPIQDALEVTSLDVEGEFLLKNNGVQIGGNPEDNLVIKAYRMLKDDYPHIPAVDIHMYKHIPIGAGLGGGSSDAAFMLKLLNEKFNLNISDSQLETYAARLGADCAFFIRNKPVFATGIGNKFEQIELSLKGLYFVLIKPEIFVSTKDAYSSVKPKHPQRSLKDIILDPIDTWKDSMVNDFEESVFLAYPEIAAIKDKLYDMGAVYASMSGSGSSVFGLFKDSVEYVDEIFNGCFCRQRLLE